MILLVAGLALWVFGHTFKRFAPAVRAGLGDKGKGGAALAILAGLVLMIWGYRIAPLLPIWSPPAFLWHVNNLLMLVAFFIFGTSQTTGRLRGWTRHPMLISVQVFAFAHLLVNGDMASILLFGGLLAWAAASIFLINRAEPDWQRPERGGATSGDFLLVAITAGTFGLTIAIHAWLGVNPFPA